jgi:RNA polymerase sigma factor (sigma-70 family)
MNDFGMQPGPQGQARILAQIERWIKEHGEAACGRIPTSEEPLRNEAAARLWQCWEYHWRQAVELNGGEVDGFEVAKRVAAGRGLLKGGRLGGNPFEDVVLAAAVLHREPVAIQRFTERFRADAIRSARKTYLSPHEDEEDWWCQFLMHLMGLGPRNGKLDRFQGRCGLKNWLPRVAKNFKGGVIRLQGGDDADWENLGDGPQPDPGERECHELLSGVLRNTLAQLTPPQRTLFYMIYVERLALKDVAPFLEIHAGNVGRHRKATIEQLDAMLAQLDDATNKGRAYQDCLKSLTDTRNWRELADVFLETLRDLHEEGEDSPQEGSNP